MFKHAGGVLFQERGDLYLERLSRLLEHRKRRILPRRLEPPRDITAQTRTLAALGADGTVSDLREIDLIRAGPIQLTVSADLGADGPQEVSSFGRQSEMNRRWRGLDEAGLYKLPHRNRSLGVLWSSLPVNQVRLRRPFSICNNTSSR